MLNGWFLDPTPSNIVDFGYTAASPAPEGCFPRTIVVSGRCRAGPGASGSSTQRKHYQAVQSGHEIALKLVRGTKIANRVETLPGRSQDPDRQRNGRTPASSGYDLRPSRVGPRTQIGRETAEQLLVRVRSTVDPGPSERSHFRTSTHQGRRSPPQAPSPSKIDDAP